MIRIVKFVLGHHNLIAIFHFHVFGKLVILNNHPLNLEYVYIIKKTNSAHIYFGKKINAKDFMGRDEKEWEAIVGKKWKEGKKRNGSASAQGHW